MTSEATHLRVVGEPGAAREDRGPLPLFSWLHAHAAHDRVEVGQAALAGAFEVSVRTVYDWLTRLERAGCLRQERRSQGVAKYHLLLSVGQAPLALARAAGTSGRTSDRTSTRHNEDFRSLPVGLPIGAGIGARDTCSSSPPSPTPEVPELPLASDRSTAPLTVSGLLLQLFAITDESVRDRFEALSEAERVAWIARMREAPPRSPGNPVYAHRLMDSVEAETLAPLVASAAAPRWADQAPSGGLDLTLDEAWLAERALALTDALFEGLRR